MKRIKLKFSKKWAAALGVLVIALLTGIIVHALNQPAVGQIDNSQAQKAEPVVKETKSKVTGKTVSFEISSLFTKSPAEKPSGNEIETFAYTKKPFPFWFLNISLTNLPSGTLSDDGSYRFRELDPSRYKKTTASYGGQVFTIFSDSSEGYAKTAFIAHSGKLFSLSLQTNDVSNTDKLDLQLAGVLSSLKWLN